MRASYSVTKVRGTAEIGAACRGASFMEFACKLSLARMETERE
jgi:hypothetical protein